MNKLLAFNYFKTHPSKTVLNLSKTSLPFLNAHITNYSKKMDSTAMIDNQSYDFVYGQENTLTTLFNSPVRMINELTRISTKGGWLETMSPITVGLYNIPPQFEDCEHLYISWTDMHTNTLCFMPFYGKMCTPAFKREEWYRLISFNPIYLTNFFTWTHPLEINFRLYSYDSREEYEYFLLKGIQAAAQHTHFLLKNYSEEQ